MSLLGINTERTYLRRPATGTNYGSRYKIQFYDDTSFNIVDDFFEFDRMKNSETKTAIDSIAQVIGEQNGIQQIIELIADTLFDNLQTPRFNDEK